VTRRFAAFKHAEDRIPIACILAFSALDFALYFSVSNPYVLGVYFYLMIIPKSQICAWNHHHQHAPTFRQTGLNRILEFFYALHTGVTTNLWVLHHVYGHHHNFLDQTKDESRWLRKDGSRMGELEYSLNVTATAYYRGYLVGKKHPKEQRDFLLFSAITFVILAAMLWYKPLAALLLFVMPMFMGLFLTAWATFEHHAGLNTNDQFEASNNNLNKWYNVFTGNLGYHTAHHYNGGLHWSKLPKLHERIADKIPAHLIKTNWV
jgi:fatty acid desaturase